MHTGRVAGTTYFARTACAATPSGQASIRMGAAAATGGLGELKAPGEEACHTAVFRDSRSSPWCVRCLDPQHLLHDTVMVFILHVHCTKLQSPRSTWRSCFGWRSQGQRHGCAGPTCSQRRGQAPAVPVLELTPCHSLITQPWLLGPQHVPASTGYKGGWPVGESGKARDAAGTVLACAAASGWGHPPQRAGARQATGTCQHSQQNMFATLRRMSTLLKALQWPPVVRQGPGAEGGTAARPRA